jgi:dienelactone hydrolase
MPSTDADAAPGAPNGAPIRAAITVPKGPGPFPAVVLLHVCAGPRNNAVMWADFLSGHGFLVAAADQFGQRGLRDICADGNRMATSYPERYLDTVALIRLMQARPDVRPDRVFVLGFSHGAHVAAAMMGPLMRMLPADNPKNLGGGPPVRAGAAVYPLCNGLPNQLDGPLLVAIGADDDWTLASLCQLYAERTGIGTIRAELVIYPGAQHGFDEPGLPPRLLLPNARNGNSPTGRGATVGYSDSARRASQRDVLAFFTRHL